MGDLSASIRHIRNHSTVGGGAVHVLFDEKIPERAEEYFRELDEAAALFTLPDAMSEEDFKYLIGTYHIDDEDQLLYITKRVVRRKGVIIAYRACVTGDKEQKEEKTPIHVQDVVRMVNETREHNRPTGDVHIVGLDQESELSRHTTPLNPEDEKEEENSLEKRGEEDSSSNMYTAENEPRGHPRLKRSRERETRIPE